MAAGRVSLQLPPMAPWQQRVHAKALEAIDQGRLPHGLLLTGPERIGKRLVAEHLAAALLCTERPIGGAACGRCRSCALFAARDQRDPLESRPDGSLAQPHGHSAHPDLLLVGYEWKLKPPQRMRTEIVIDQIRGLTDKFALSAQFGARVAIVEPADAVNYHAWNAILKSLEEPQEGRYLLLVSSSPSRLPATIRSRCQVLEFRLPTQDEALAWLRAQGHPAKAASEALEAARGHPGLAHDWLERGELALRREVAGDLDQLAKGRAAVVDTAQRWTGDEQAALRLRFAAEIALEQAGASSAGGLTDPLRTRRLASWFDAANRTRDLLRTTVRSDLAVAELLLAWRRQGQGNDATEGR